MNRKLTLAGLKEIRLPRSGHGEAGVFARDARALFKQPETAGTNDGSLVDFLARVGLFETLDRRELTRLARIVHERDYADGEYVCEEGRPGAAVFIVRRGVVEVVRRGGRAEETSIALFEPPTSFDESAAVGAGMIRWFSVRARGPVSLLALGKSDLDALSGDFPSLANKILARLAAIMAIRLQMLIEVSMHEESGEPGEVHQ
jgi:CRP/FNR family transcriptional regulator